MPHNGLMRNATGRLVLAGTPIGDVGDASPRLGEVLASADVIAAEDTRRFRTLCARLGVTPSGQVVSYFDGNEAEKTPGLVRQMRDGATVVLVTDAGMPGVSDPGYRLVRAALDEGLPVDVIPGPSAALTALVVSGLPVRRFCFEGFPPRKTIERARHLASLAHEARTMVFFESPRRLAAFLDAAVEAFGGDRPGAVCRELTKPFEEVIRGPLSDLALWAGGEVRGEISIVIGGWDGQDEDAGDALAVAVAAVRRAMAKGETASAAVAQVAQAQGLRRKTLYDAVVTGTKAMDADGAVSAGKDQTIETKSVPAPQPVPVTADIATRLADHGFADLPDRLPRPVTDSHTHMDSVFEKTGLTPEDNLEAAVAVGVKRVVQIGCDLESSRWAADFAATHSSVIAAVAIHPNDAARLGDAELDQQIAQIEALAASGPAVRAIGETGLDYYLTRDDAGRSRQRRSFANHIAIAAQLGLTLAIHNRDSHADILRLLDDAPLRPPRVIMHCFSGDAEYAEQCLARGYWLSFPGTITFKNADDLRGALAVTPLDKLLVETDAPYLTPVPARGRPNASYLVAHTVRFVAEQLSVDLAVLCDALTANATAAYGGDWGAVT